jgi:hypothetical protein
MWPLNTGLTVFENNNVVVTIAFLRESKVLGFFLRLMTSWTVILPITGVDSKVSYTIDIVSLIFGTCKSISLILFFLNQIVTPYKSIQARVVTIDINQ